MANDNALIEIFQLWRTSGTVSADRRRCRQIGGSVERGPRSVRHGVVPNEFATSLRVSMVGGLSGLRSAWSMTLISHSPVDSGGAGSYWVYRRHCRSGCPERRGEAGSIGGSTASPMTVLDTSSSTPSCTRTSPSASRRWHASVKKPAAVQTSRRSRRRYVRTTASGPH